MGISAKAGILIQDFYLSASLNFGSSVRVLW